MTNYWLMKAEPAEASIDDVLAMPDATIGWTGVRNYQARNFMRDDMQVGDGVLFYHSSCAEPGIRRFVPVTRLRWRISSAMIGRILNGAADSAVA